MALANVACLLARRCREDRGALIVDWNLEAPSLHRFFHGKLAGLDPAEVEAAPGLLDLFQELDTQIPQTGAGAAAAVEAVDPMRFILPTHAPGVSLLKAGRF